MVFGVNGSDDMIVKVLTYSRGLASLCPSF